MHFNIYIDDKTGTQLNKLAKTLGETRNALIRKAIEEWVTQHLTPQWPEKILSFKGIKDFPPFENSRKKLKNPKDDPLA